MFRIPIPLLALLTHRSFRVRYCRYENADTRSTAKKERKDYSAMLSVSSEVVTAVDIVQS